MSVYFIICSPSGIKTISLFHLHYDVCLVKMNLYSSCFFMYLSTPIFYPIPFCLRLLNNIHVSMYSIYEPTCKFAL
jgi:hypothetical protein